MPLRTLLSFLLLFARAPFHFPGFSFDWGNITKGDFPPLFSRGCFLLFRFFLAQIQKRPKFSGAVSKIFQVPTRSILVLLFLLLFMRFHSFPRCHWKVISSHVRLSYNEIVHVSVEHTYYPYNSSENLTKRSHNPHYYPRFMSKRLFDAVVFRGKQTITCRNDLTCIT